MISRLDHALPKNPKIIYLNGDENMLNDVRCLWEALNLFYRERSSYFKLEYCEMTFEKRKMELLKKKAFGNLRVDLAVDESTGQKIGYCLSSINMDATGEVESIFVSGAYRGLGIGESLIKKALRWMDQNGAKEKLVEVGTGNEKAYGFYARYGFFPRKTLLRQIK